MSEPKALRDLRRERRAEWVAYYRAQIRAAESMRERAEARLLRLLDEGARGA